MNRPTNKGPNRVIPIINEWVEIQETNESNISEIAGIRRLAAACLVRNILDSRGEFSGCAESASPFELMSTANNWIFLSKLKSKEAFSFSWICDVLNVDPEVIRLKIKSLPMMRSTKRFYYATTPGTRNFEQPNQLGPKAYGLKRQATSIQGCKEA